jgi:Uma2 family endonuclease
VKRPAYHRAGVQECAIIDRFQQTATVLTRGDTDFPARALLPDDTYTTPLLPGLEVPLADVLGRDEVEP